MAFLPAIFLLLLFTFSNFYAECRKDLIDMGVHKGSITQLRHSIQSNSIDPSRVVQLSWQPRVFLYSGFLSDEECDHLISLGRGEKEGKLGTNDDVDSIGEYMKLTSSKSLPDKEDKVLAAIEERISSWTFLPKENSKSLQVRQYRLERTEGNLDYFGNTSMLTLNNPLMATVVLYLSNVTSGGGIVFPYTEPKSKIWSNCGKTTNILKPVKGNAFLFFTSRLDASPDSSSLHARCPVREGEMWCAVKLFYVRAVNGEKVSFDSDGSECIDEDVNCAQWAAMGECKRNPIFMVGSTDYYGTCRKSCNAC